MNIEKKPKNEGGVSREHKKSLPEKLTFALLHLFIVLFCVWLVYADGVEEVGALFDEQWKIIDPNRANILLACTALYWIRHTVTLFYLLQRKVAWSEAFGLLSVFVIFEVLFVMVGGGVFRIEPVPLGWLDTVAFALLTVGSFLNTFSEMQRKWWKEKRSSKGQCYTQGLFRYATHINFFGDVVLFTGWALFTHNVWSLGLPLVMLFMFIFMHVPALDTYLSQRYGKAFDDYALKTKKLIPFIY